MSGLEIPAGDHVVRVTHPERVIFPETGVTKGELALYYASVGDGILRALRDRPTTLERYPEGITGERFYSKRVPKGAPAYVKTTEITFPSGRNADEVCPDSLATILWCVQMGTLPFHPWPVRDGDVDHPDELRIDLDPQPGTGFAEAVEASRAAKEILDALELTGWPKTSGSRGVHIYVRIEPRWGFSDVRRAALAFGRALERMAPDLVTTAWWKEERGAKIFSDYNQNARDRTIASAWSVRPKPTATVSTPMTWEELFSGVDPLDFTVRTVPERFAAQGDVHSGIDAAVGTLDALLHWADVDEHERGLADAPYPPDFPKMPGEPKRVQPSRARQRKTEES
jgi:DNA ligase D